MKPRTKRQMLVCELSERLPDLTTRLEPWAFKNCIEHIGYRNKMWTSCLSCGHVWPTTSMEIKAEVCSGCGWKLRLETTRKKKSREWARFAVLDVKEGIQIIRYFDINCHMRAARLASIYTREIMQQWLFPDGGFEIVSRQVGGMGLSYEHFWGYMTLKNKNKHDLWKYNILVYKIYPKMKLAPVYKRNGFVASLKNIPPFDLLRTLPNDSRTETLLKTKQFSLLHQNLGGRGSGIERYWPSVKICIRNKYIVRDATTWLDYLDLLHYFGKDLHNAKYVCPANLTRGHDRLVKKKDEISKRQKLAKRMKQVEDDQIEYVKSKSIFFGIAFSDTNLEVKVLEHVKEFIEEAEIHKHCLYSNRYFDKEDSLILSARINGLPIETVEVSLSKLKVIQSRGLGNKASDYHEQIVQLVNTGIRREVKAITSNGGGGGVNEEVKESTKPKVLPAPGAKTQLPG